MRKKPARNIALGGMLAALITVLFCFGGMIPVATYVCPVLGILVCQLVRRLTGDRLAWAWYAAVSLLVSMLCPDKEAAALFVLLGYYPIIKVGLEKLFLPSIWKVLYFNALILFFYCAVSYVLGMEQILLEYSSLGFAGILLLFVMGNIVFFLLDFLLSRSFTGKGGHRG